MKYPIQDPRMAKRTEKGPRQAAALFTTLRQLLRRRGLGYRELGKRLGLSESGVKKIFSGGNCSVRRLAQIAAVLEVPLSELTRLAEQPAIRQVELSDEQQQWLLENLDCFAFYWKLAVEKQSLASIQAEHRLDRAAVWRYLGRLDDLGLVVVEPGDRVRIVQEDLVRWEDRGPLLAHLNRSWSTTLVDDALREPGAEGRVFRLTHLQMRAATARELCDALERLVDEFVRRARFEQATTPADALVTERLLVALARGSFVGAISAGAGARPPRRRSARRR
jgi:transcriptional regulator with XRE-family HTH domain